MVIMSTISLQIGALLFKSGGWRHLDRQALAAIKTKQSGSDALPIAVSAASPPAVEELMSIAANLGGVAVAGCLTGGELTPADGRTHLQTLSSLLLVFRSASNTTSWKSL